ncbi:MAG: radical SAM protein [Deltaproteobacteria bacterium]|nr:radical SAM protein [Deltaproteobacteria bacterium]
MNRRKTPKSVARSTPPEDEIEFREAVAIEKRFWLKISRVCNNRCLFCLDSDQQDGVFNEFDDLVRSIREARSGGAERLILSGGEPTIHPRFADLAAAATGAGYTWVQAISNGRMFAYRDFARRAVKTGLREVTVSMHGHTPALHDRLTGIPGSFEQSLTGIKNLQDLGCLVTVDVVINDLNHAHLPAIVRTFEKSGVKEFDLLHITPFGRAYNSNFKTLFGADYAGSIAKAIAAGRKLGCTMWTNRVPPEMLEGLESFIQDPHKLTDEVRGRRLLFDEVIAGKAMRCEKKDRCRHCFVKDLCPFLGGDVAAASDLVFSNTVARARAAPEAVIGVLGDRKVRLKSLVLEIDSLRDAAKGRALVEAAWPKKLDVRLGAGFKACPDDVRDVVRVFPGATFFSADPGIVKRILALGVATGVVLNRATARLLSDRRVGAVIKKARVRVEVPAYALLSEGAATGIPVGEAAAFAAKAGAGVEGLPFCLGGVPHDPDAIRLDALRLGDDGRLTVDLDAFADDYLARRHMTKSRRCKKCVKNRRCPGIHINHARAWGYRALKPLG